MGTVIITTKNDPGRVLGVHGGKGELLWKRLATGSHLYAKWEGFEWVALEPGGRVGKHTHTHTEEVFYFLTGRGELILDGDLYQVQPGDACITPLGSWHSVLNTSTEQMSYIVVEVFPPVISDALPARRPTDEGI